MADSERMDLAVKGVVGKRLMFDQLTGNVTNLPRVLTNRQGRGKDKTG